MTMRAPGAGGDLPLERAIAAQREAEAQERAPRLRWSGKPNKWPAHADVEYCQPTPKKKDDPR